MLKLLVLLLSYVSLSVQINGYPDHREQCVFACMEAFYAAVFGTYSETDDWYTGWCQDYLHIESAWICAHQRCTPSEIKAGVAYYQKWYCDMATPEKVEMISYDAVMANYSEADIAAMPVINVGEDLSATIYNNTLVASDELFDSSRRTWVRLHIYSSCNRKLIF